MALSPGRVGVFPCFVVAVLALAAMLSPGAASAQEDQLRLRLLRTFGFAMGSTIQGSFLLSVDGPPDLHTVSFYVDDGVIETAVAAPFEARLHTGDFPTGTHLLWAQGTRGDGRTLRSNEVRLEFVSADAGWAMVGRTVVPLLITVGLLVAAGVGLTLVSSRRFQPGVYGAAGGAVCPHCTLPMNRHVLAPNVGMAKKLERCPHCGRLSLVVRASAEALPAAEARLRGEASPQPSPESREEELRRQVDESRFLE